MENEASSQQPEAQTSDDILPLESIRTEPKGEKTTHSEDESNNSADPPDNVRKITWLEYVLAATNIALVFVGIWALTVYKGQLNVMQGQVDQMSTDSRPWIKVVEIRLDDSIPDAPIISFLQVPATPKAVDGMNLRVEFAIKNIGKGVAQNMFIWPGIVFE
jgi:hypothetical protein